jgi:hypothetical protein
MRALALLLASLALAACKDLPPPAQAASAPAAATPPATSTPPADATPTDAASPAGAPSSRAAAAPDGGSCEDAWLLAHSLNEYGDPEGTMYTGGTPLFDERTGQRKDRLQHLRAKLPALRTACAR